MYNKKNWANFLKNTFCFSTILKVFPILYCSLITPLKAMEDEKEPKKGVLSSQNRKDYPQASSSLSRTQSPHPTKNEIWVLSIDGGGIRGIIPVKVLSYIEEGMGTLLKKHLKSEIEERLGSPLDPNLEIPLKPLLAKVFDVMAGTSTGGIITLGLNVPDPDDRTSPKYHADTLVNLYKDKGNRVFPPSYCCFGRLNLLSPKFDPQELENLLKEYFGKSTLKDTVTKVVVPAYEMREERLMLFNSETARISPKENFFLKDVARATSAAPTYLPAASIKNLANEEHLFVDGGIVANNPSMAAFTQAKIFFPEARKINLLSLGTGMPPEDNLSKIREKGKIEWGLNIADIMITGASDFTDQLLHDTEKASNGTFSYLRLQPPLHPSRSEMDNVKEGNLHNLLSTARKLKNNNSQKLGEVIEKLTAAYEARGYPLFPGERKKLESCINLNKPSKFLSLLGFNLSNILVVWDIDTYLQRQKLTTFTKLNLEGTDLRDEGLLLLIKTLSSLTSLNVKDNKLSDEGAKHVVVYLPSLTFLDMSGNNVTRKSLKIIVNKLKNLSFLGLSDVGFNDSDIQLISKKLSSGAAKLSIINLAQQISTPALNWMKSEEKENPEITNKRKEIYEQGILEATDKGDLSKVKKILGEKDLINVNFVDKEGRSLLERASFHGYSKIVSYLLSVGANVNYKDKIGNTALYMACEAGHKKVAEKLIKGGAEINHSDDGGVTALHIAVDRRHIAIVELLCQQENVEVNFKMKNGLTPCAIAKAQSQQEIMNCLKKRGANDGQ